MPERRTPEQWKDDARVLEEFLAAFKKYRQIPNVRLPHVIEQRDRARSHLNRLIAAATGAAERAGGVVYVDYMGRRQQINVVSFALESLRSLGPISANSVLDYTERAIAQANLNSMTPPSEQAARRYRVMLHPQIEQASARLLDDGHPAAAVLEALKAVDNRVRGLAGIQGSGKPLMMSAFDEQRPQIQINEGVTQSDADEQEGFKFIFAGAMLGVRNPKAHDLFGDLDEERAIEYLALASLLMRRLDDAEELRRGPRKR